MMLKVMEIIGYCPAAARHTCAELPVAHTQQIWMEQTVIRRLNGFSVVVNCSLDGKVEKKECDGIRAGVSTTFPLTFSFRQRASATSLTSKLQTCLTGSVD